MRYRRSHTTGGCFFFTVVTDRRRPLLATPSAVSLLREAMRTVRSRHAFRLDAAVILPDHLHCIWTLPPGDHDFATRWRLIKAWFTRHCDPALRGQRSASRRRRREQAVWQRRYWEHEIRNEADFIGHMEYIHYNPVRHGLALRPQEWPYSSFHRYVAAGVYPADWGGDGIVEVAGAGE